MGEEILRRIEADRRGLPASSFIRLLIKQYFNGVKFEKGERK